MKTQNLIEKILDRKLKNEIENILAITKQGFDIYIHIEFPEIASALNQLLECETKINPRVFRLISDPKQIEINEDADLDFTFIPVVLTGHHTLKNGTGFVRYNLESPDKLLGQVGIAIEDILTNFELQSYLDCFDSQLFSKLKDVARIHGIKCLVDAVIQTAYLAGFRGDEASAHHYLNTFNTHGNIENNEITVSIETCAKRYLSHCITYGEHALDFLKSSLSFYVVGKQGHTMTRASQILNISRTTLLEHLKTAEKLSVPRFFGE